jgi:hypothetical protein
MVNGFIDHLYTLLVSTSNYSSTANLRTLQFHVTPTNILGLIEFPLSVS